MQKSGLITLLTEKPKNLNERSQRYWSDLADQWHSFDSREQIAAEVANLTQADMQAFFQRLQRHLQDQRLLIFTQGRFEEVPSRGRLLAGATAALHTEAPQS